MSKRGVVRILIAASIAGVIWCAGNRERVYAQIGQGATATLTGRISDQSGAVIPGASLTLVNKVGGLPHSTVSNNAGYYTFPLLAPGTYTLTAKKAGFADVVIPAITLAVNQTSSVNITLKPGTLTQQITVSAASVALQTQSSALTGVVSNNVEEQLPLTFRDPSQLINLVAGVSSDMRSSGLGAAYADSNGLSYQGRLDFKINGGTNEQAIAMVDGVDVTIDAAFASVPIITTPDNTQEFSVLTNDYSAQYGRGTGILNIVTKSGTNSLHGSVYEFLQNNALNANDLFSNSRGLAIPHEERNQYGFAVGGPVWLPHIYNGRNRTFWFMDLERLSQTRALPLSFHVPSAAQRNGDFSNYYATNGQPIAIYDALATTTASNGAILRTSFLGNKIPASTINPFATKVMSYFPLPNNPGIIAPNGGFTGISDYNVAGTAPLDFDRYDIKIDHDLSNTNRLMGRYSKSLYHVVPVNYFGDNSPAYSWGPTTRDNIQNGYNLVLSDTWTASPSLVITQAINWSRLVDGNVRLPSFDLTQLGGPFASGAIKAYASAYDGGAAFPNIGIGNYAPMGNSFGTVFTEPYSNYEYEFGVTKTHGKHTISAGFQGILLQGGANFLEGFGGTYNFPGSFSCGPNPLACSAFTGDGLADLELGLITSGQEEGGYSTLETSKYAGWYVQDDIKLTKKLTVNLGLRYDFTTPYNERFNQNYHFIPTLPNPLGQLTGPNTGGKTVNQVLANLGAGPLVGTEEFVNSPGSSGREIVPTDYDDIAPRLGFAYSLRSNLVIRGGWAKLYTLSPEAPNPPQGLGPFSATTPIVGTVNNITPNVTIDNPFPNGFVLPTGASQGLLSQVGFVGIPLAGNGWHTPFEYQWNFGVETLLPGNSTLSIAYAGTTSHYLQCPIGACGNEVPYPLIQKYGPKLVQAAPNPYYGIITNPSALLRAPAVPLGLILSQWGAFPGNPIILPSIQGPGVNQDVFQSGFNALEVQYQKHFSHGLSIMAAYTWSKELTNADSAVGGFLGPVVGYQNRVTFAGEWSPSAESVPQRLVIGHVYDLPVGHGERFGSSWPPAVDKVLGHWQFSGITTFQSGFPLPISVAGVQNGSFGGGERPNMLPGANPCVTGLSRAQLIRTGGLNPAAFSAPANFTFGDAPRTLGCLSNGERNFDWALIKFIPINERVKAEFRAEFFNAFNRPQLAEPNTTLNSGAFGLINSQANSPRVIQFGLKFTW